MTRHLTCVVALAATAVLAAACGGTGSEVPGTQPAPSTTSTTAPTSPAPTSPALTSPSPGGGGAAPVHPTWGSGPVTVRHDPPVPPVPVVTGIRYAAHSVQGYDRIVFDISGGLPGYSVRYVSQVRADPSDRPVTVPGRRHLLVVLTPAQAHRDNGATTVSGVHRTDLPMLKSYAVVGDFEGYVSIALGLDDVVGFRVGELPGRIYLDVAA
jgi:hypothetical protein